MFTKKDREIANLETKVKNRDKKTVLSRSF